METCTISDMEWGERMNRWDLDPQQALLSLLKEKGAPIKGHVILKADMENYIWYREDDCIEGSKFGWKKKDDSSHE